MAYSTSDKYQALSREWDQAITSYEPSWTKFVELVTDTNSTTMVRFADAPVASLRSWNGSAEITAVPYGSSHEQSVTLAGAASRIVINDIDARVDPGLIDRKAADLLAATQATVESEVYTLLESVFTASFDNGAGSTTEICSTGHMTNVDQGSNLVGEVAQSNLLTTALSYDGLNSALELGHKWTNFAGEPMGLFRGPSTLIVSPKNRAVAAQLCQSAQLIASGTGSSAAFTGNSNPNTGVQFITSSHLTSDDDDWFLVDDQNSPVKCWMPFAPKLTIENLNTHQVELCVSMWLKCFIECPPNGLVGANVA